MLEEELPESESSDEDFVPTGEHSEVSEDESDGPDVEEERETQTDSKKRKQSKSSKPNRKKKKKEPVEEESAIEEKQPEEEESPEERKKKADALWADFLKDCGPVIKKKESSQSAPSSLKPESSSSQNQVDRKGTSSSSVSSSRKMEDIFKTEQNDKIVEVYEFAGEKVLVEKKVDPQKRPPPGRGGGGAAAILSQLNRKNKLSTLEKSKLDWNSFKEREGISEQLSAHNRGKNGYLEKQEFLERADLRQFEIEKQMRDYNRSKRL